MEMEVLVVEIGITPVEGLGILGSHLRGTFNLKLEVELGVENDEVFVCVSGDVTVLAHALLFSLLSSPLLFRLIKAKFKVSSERAERDCLLLCGQYQWAHARKEKAVAFYFWRNVWRSETKEGNVWGSLDQVFDIFRTKALKF